MATSVRSADLVCPCAKPFEDDITIDAISIANDVRWRLLPTVSLGQLTGDPIGTRARGQLANVRRCHWPAAVRSRFQAPIGSDPARCQRKRESISLATALPHDRG